ncbi:class II D-tagatose-bisphosphate aldolase, non-catalytic subunit [Acetobacter oeni]|uniref:D-tagatose-bisphosphate aldolase, class II, non-catalytic subunit n=1 Tax=Acetobacter oeni TaxID=304077 RepID=A0A511XR75_9PROT|nr:class II D-tagatose-bisphosphate aldolase, non-catalytic subunit [Acetobacter oeni]MBB3885000.1 D-tagatose-1,6-bisphosphate aldolase subunit GatZ/KbaZ [Acetobacter oeni]NHO20867.1 tagatose-bisphosphate aldolase [Acetobacter oeni]GBR06763.1 putative tagatose 6-phosphate kinase [Acetobacter oeni LMG 21952]GEN65396.1 D-tagatose-bisphosphate aldolase, class II, non-catalytic subunit [Acetobacter oeni]
MSIAPFFDLVKQIHDPLAPRGSRRGLTSVCSAHPLVLEAALGRAARLGEPVLIEATCNQVNQEGGYTGMTPVDFLDLLRGIAEKVGCPSDLILAGGDHLGPSPWKTLPADEALSRAGDMVEAYARAGFVKLHLDASMGCAGESAALADDIVAARVCALAARAEAVAPGRVVYVIGTEVPVPGGAAEALDHLTPTSPSAAAETLRLHETVFRAALGDEVWSRVIALVVQPGVEFGVEEVALYDRDRARSLSDVLGGMPGRIFEAHSTDYQTGVGLRALVEDGFALLKVGPGLTFALREALYALDALRGALLPQQESLRDVMERVMLHDSSHWAGHYEGSPSQLTVLRHYAWSDRIRYYWPKPEAGEAVDTLFSQLADIGMPDPLIRQFLPTLFARLRSGGIAREPQVIVIAAVTDVLDMYGAACTPESGKGV